MTGRTVTPFAAEDLHLLNARSSERDGMNPALCDAADVFAAGRAFTIWTGAGEGSAVPVFCGGAVEQHAHHATLWSSFAVEFPDRLAVFLTLAVKRFIAELPHLRVDAMVRDGNEKAARWMYGLGFTLEARLADYFPGGEDVLIFRLERR